MEVIDRSGARFFVMENVPQLLGSLEYQEIVCWARERGFNIWSGILLAADYGVPQTRRRAFIVGAKDTEPNQFFPPLKTNYDPQKIPQRFSLFPGVYKTDAEEWRTVRNAIEDLPSPGRYGNSR